MHRDGVFNKSFNSGGLLIKRPNSPQPSPVANLVTSPLTSHHFHDTQLQTNHRLPKTVLCSAYLNPRDQDTFTCTTAEMYALGAVNSSVTACVENFQEVDDHDEG